MIRISLHNLYAHAQTKSPEIDHKQTQKKLRGLVLAYIHTHPHWVALTKLKNDLTDMLLTRAHRVASHSRIYVVRNISDNIEK